MGQTYPPNRYQWYTSLTIDGCVPCCPPARNFHVCFCPLAAVSCIPCVLAAIRSVRGPPRFQVRIILGLPVLRVGEVLFPRESGNLSTNLLSRTGKLAPVLQNDARSIAEPFGEEISRWLEMVGVLVSPRRETKKSRPPGYLAWTRRAMRSDKREGGTSRRKNT